MADLNKILDYDLIGKQPTISAAAQAKIDGHVIVDKDDWGDSFSKDFIKEAKTFYARRQNIKCGYCRKSINIDGSGNAVDHITARIRKPHWMFVLHNLVVVCDNCNSKKTDKNVLINNHTTYGDLPANCPNSANDYHIFNPHYDKWSNHFEVEDGYFLKPKTNTKGPFTYTECGMNSYLIIVDYLFQQKVRQPNSRRILAQRIRKEKDPRKIEVLKEALDCIEDINE